MSGQHSKLTPEQAAGLNAAALIGLAEHIASFKLPLFTIQAAQYYDGRKPLSVHVPADSWKAWLNTVEIDHTDNKPLADDPSVYYTTWQTRLPGSGLRVEISARRTWPEVLAGPPAADELGAPRAAREVSA